MTWCLPLLVVLLWAPPAFGQPPAVLRGAVHDPTGAPLDGATIVVRGVVSRTVVSDASGGFELPALPPGVYELSASFPGFATLLRSVQLDPGGHVVLKLELPLSHAEHTVVSASRTGELDVQTIPMAVSVLPGSDLNRLQVHTIEALAGRAPTVTFSQNTGFAQLTIRGIGSNVVFAGSDPSSAVYVDGVYLSRPAMLLTDFLDLERVEVLRGPQGTLYGRNAVGGALHVITKNPSDVMEASARLVGGTLDTGRAEARVSGPILRGRLLGSVTFLRGVMDGFVRDRDHPDHPLGGEDVTAARAKLHAVVNRRIDLLLSGEATHEDPAPLVYAKVLAVKPGFRVDNPPDLHEVRTSTLAESEKIQYAGSARLTVRLAPATTLTSLTAYRKLNYELLVDADITELDLAISNVRERQHQISQEVTLSQTRSNLTWVGGMFLLDESDRQPTIVTLGGPRLQNHLNPRLDATTQAVFGQATVPLVSNLSATAGLRYTREHKTYNNAGQLQTLDPPITVVPPSAYSYTDALSHTAWTPKAGLEWRAGAQTMTYVSAARGFKSGGFNLTSTAAGRGFDPESAWSYEAGVKTRLAREFVRVNVAAFETDYSRLQVQTAIVPGVIDISNAAEATIRGVEVEADTARAGPVRMGGHVAWLRAKYDRYIAVGVGGVTGDVAGKRLNNAPEWSGRVWLEWTRHLGNAGALSSRADTRWQSTVYFTPFNDAVQRQQPYGLLDLSAEFQPARRGWSVGLYARNLTDEDYITGSFSSPQPAFGGRPAEPRRIGVQFTIAR